MFYSTISSLVTIKLCLYLFLFCTYKYNNVYTCIHGVNKARPLMKCWVTMYINHCASSCGCRNHLGLCVPAVTGSGRSLISPPKHVNSPVNLGSVATFYDETQQLVWMKDALCALVMAGTSLWAQVVSRHAPVPWCVPRQDFNNFIINKLWLGSILSKQYMG